MNKSVKCLAPNSWHFKWTLSLVIHKTPSLQWKYIVGGTSIFLTFPTQFPLWYLFYSFHVLKIYIFTRIYHRFIFFIFFRFHLIWCHPYTITSYWYYLHFYIHSWNFLELHNLIYQLKSSICMHWKNFQIYIPIV